MGSGVKKYSRMQNSPKRKPRKKRTRWACYLCGRERSLACAGAAAVMALRDLRVFVVKI